MADKRVTAWARAVPAASVFLSVVTIQELEIGGPLVTRNVSDFQRMGAKVVDPWTA